MPQRCNSQQTKAYEVIKNHETGIMIIPLNVTYFHQNFWTWEWPPELHNVIFVTRIKIWVQNFTPKTRKSRLFVFTTKHVNPLLFGLTAEVSGVKLPQLNGFFNKDLHSVKNAYVTPKKFTPDLQIFYTFPVFGLNVHVLGVKVPPNAMKRIIFIKLYPTSKRRMLLSENLPQTSRFFTRIYPQYPWHYATLKTSQELRMLSTVTLICQVTMIATNSGSQLSEL